jgi:replicative DNA helicase
MMAPTPQLDLGGIEAEQALLGTLLYGPEAFEAVQDITKPAHFSEGFHARLFEAIADQSRKGRGVEFALLAPRFANDPAFQELGGIRYLADLVDRAPPVTSAPEYAHVLSSLHTRQQLVELGQEVAAAARAGEGEAEDLIAHAEQMLTKVAEGSPVQEAWATAAQVIETAIQSARTRDGHMDAVTGLSEVDELIGGFGKGEVTIIGGRPGMAKSLAASQIAKANAQRGKGVVFFSQEMGPEPLGLRLACDLAYDRRAIRYMGVSGNPTFDAARKNKLSAAQWQRLSEAGDETQSWPILFDVRPGLTVAQIEAASRRVFRRWKRQGVEPGCIVIDHLGIIRPGTDRKGAKHAEVADISRALAVMAKRLNVAVVVLCQLNRQVETQRGEDKRPQLSDLRQAGEIEEDARCVIFLLRPAYYFRKPDDPASESMDARVERETKLDKVRDSLFWIIAKNSNGQLGQVETFIDVGCAAIRDRVPS